MNIVDQIIERIRTQLTTDPGAIDIDCKLAEGGYLDSTAMLELILWVGDTFHITIENEDLIPENFATPRNIADFVEQRMQRAPESDLQRTQMASD
jgi:acyl carrier protein